VLAQVAGIAVDDTTMASVVAALGSNHQPVAIDRARIDRQIRELALEHAAGLLGDDAYLTRLKALREQRDATTERTVTGLSGQRAVGWLRVLGQSLKEADVPAEKSNLLHAIYERIVVAGPEIIGVVFTAAAYAHGLALALPEKVVMARPKWRARQASGAREQQRRRGRHGSPGSASRRSGTHRDDHPGGIHRETLRRGTTCHGRLASGRCRRARHSYTTTDSGNAKTAVADDSGTCCRAVKLTRRQPQSDLDLVDPAPAPRVSGYLRPDDRVTRLGEVGSRVPIRRHVATTDMTAGEAEPKLDPLAADRQAFLATIGARLHVACLVEMRAHGRGGADEPTEGVNEPRHHSQRTSHGRPGPGRDAWRAWRA
jgi:hypothetical protein